MQLPSSFVIGCSFCCLASSGPALADEAPPPAALELTQPSDRVSDHPAEDGFLSYESEGRGLRYQLEPADAEPPSPTSQQQSASAGAADDGLFLPYTVSPRIRAGRSWVRAVSGYDSAVSAMRARTAAESAATRWLAIRVEYEHGPSTGAHDRVNLGGRVQWLNQRKHGVDLGVIAFYQPKDFREEGNIVGGLSLGRTEGRFGIFGTALIGSDPEGDDQTTDGRLSFVYRMNELLQLGLDNRFEYVLSSDAKRFGTTTTDWELAIEPTAVISLGPLALLTEAGLSAVQTTGPFGARDQQRHVHTGAIAMAGASATF
jgi:hypothetical protein